MKLNKLQSREVFSGGFFWQNILDESLIFLEKDNWNIFLLVEMMAYTGIRILDLWIRNPFAFPTRVRGFHMCRKYFSVKLIF